MEFKLCHVMLICKYVSFVDLQNNKQQHATFTNVFQRVEGQTCRQSHIKRSKEDT